MGKNQKDSVAMDTVQLEFSGSATRRICPSLVSHAARGDPAVSRGLIRRLESAVLQSFHQVVMGGARLNRGQGDDDKAAYMSCVTSSCVLKNPSALPWCLGTQDFPLVTLSRSTGKKNLTVSLGGNNIWSITSNRFKRQLYSQLAVCI